MSESIVVIGGVGGTRARLDDLDRAARLLETAASHLEVIGRASRVASGIVAGLEVTPERVRERDRTAGRLAWIDQGQGGSTETALAVEDIARNLRETVRLLEEAESAAESTWGWVGRLGGKIVSVTSVMVWVPAKVVGAGAGTLLHGVESATPDWLPTHWMATGGAWVADTVNPDWTPDTTPLLYGDDLQEALKNAGLAYQVLTTPLRVFPGADLFLPDDLVEGLSWVLASVSLALDEVLGGLRDVLVFPVTARATEPPASMADLFGRLSRLSPTGEDGASRIAIERIEGPDGTRSWIVEIPGTQDWIPDGGTNIIDGTSNFLLMSTGESDLTRAVETAMGSAGVRPGEEVLLVGHSQGGIAAMRLASTPAFTDRYSVAAVLTCGAPVGKTDPAPGIQVLSLEHPSDTVPALDGSPNPDRPNWTTARRDLAKSDNPVDRMADSDLLDRHSLETYQRTAAAVEAHPDPSVRRWLEETDAFWAGGGGTSTRIVFETTRSTTGLTIPSTLPVRVPTSSPA